jgi:virginiamycin A acetyltransferase
MFRASSPLLGTDVAFRALSESIALVPGPVGIIVRRAVYSQLLARVGTGVSIGFGTIIAHRTVELGDNVYVGRYCLLGNVRIGDDCLVADYVRMVTGTHGTEPTAKIREQDITYATIHIGEDCWLANGAIVLADVGAHSVIGAGSVVTREVSEGLIVAGNPARTIRARVE